MRKARGVFILYNVLLCIALPFVALYVLVRWRGRVAKGFQRWGERWGRLSLAQCARLRNRRWWWVHAVSLGEVKAIETFLRRARGQIRDGVLLSVMTPEALDYAQDKQLADEVIAAPIDLPWVVRRVFQQVQPRLFISVESEFWPNLLRGAKRSGARVALINGRLSERSFRSYRRIRFFLNALWECFDFMAVRSEQDAERFRALGVRPEIIHVTGNLKYDNVRRLMSDGAPAESGPLTIVLGSTREKEETELVPVIEKLRGQFSALRVIWAPRHLERVGELESLFGSRGIAYKKKSAPPSSGVPEAPPAPYLVWDSMGDLLDAYRQADVAVIGGSFVPKGGQNPIEPAALEVPVVFGPSMDNFYGIAEALVRSGGARQVTLATLESCLHEILADPQLRREMGERARVAVESQQGATDRTLRLLEGWLGRA